MIMRMSPDQYFGLQENGTYQDGIPSWVPILLGIALIGAFAVAIYAIKR